MPLCGLVLHHDDVRAIVCAKTLLQPCDWKAQGPRVAASRGCLEGYRAPEVRPQQPTGSCFNAFAARGDRLAAGVATLAACTLAPGLLCHDVILPGVPRPTLRRGRYTLP